MMPLFVLLMMIIASSAYLVFAFGSEMPLLIKIFWPVVALISLIGVLISPLNGMFVGKRGTVWFIPDIRIKRFKSEDLKRIALNFSEWGNDKYSVSVKFVYKDGSVFAKDYAKQFRNMSTISKKMTMSMYTIGKEKVDKICDKLSGLDICVITILDRNGKVIYQNLNTRDGLF